MYYKDVKLKLTREQWYQFTPPEGITVLWDFKNYDNFEHTIVGRFMVSEAHQNPNQQKTKEDLDKYLNDLGKYVISDNARHRGFDDKECGQKTVSYMDHPYNSQVPKDVDIHLSHKEKELRKTITRDELEDVNRTIIDNASKFPELKKFRDTRFKPKEIYDSKGNKNYEIYTAVLEEIN